jgi:hypothetical protein
VVRRAVAWYYVLGIKEDASSRSAQHVSDKHLSIMRSVRLQITSCGVVSCCSGGLAVRRAAAWYYVLGVKEDACQA